MAKNLINTPGGRTGRELGSATSVGGLTISWWTSGLVVGLTGRWFTLIGQGRIIVRSEWWLD